KRQSGLTEASLKTTMDRAEPEPPLELPPPEESAPPPVAAPKPEEEHPHISAPRLLFTVAVSFTIIFLFLRTMTVEPFGVPTGSMAPALIGNHRECPCPRCTYPIRVGIPARGDLVRPFNDVACPNCGKHITLADAREINGDRLLVDKNIFTLRSPRRWEVAVFRCAADLSKPYVKRVVGLPGERITLVDGDVYNHGELLRKALPEVRETRLLIFDMAFVPNPGGWGDRWLVAPPGNDPRLPASTHRPPAPADASVVYKNTITLDAAESSQKTVGLTYHHRDLDDSRNGVPKLNSTVEYRKDIITSWNSYDGARPDIATYPVHDFMVECEIEVVSVAGEGTFACRLFDGTDSVNADLSVGQRSKGAHLIHEGGKGLASVGGVALERGRIYKFEFAFVDRRASLALDGKLLASGDLPKVRTRGDVRKPLQLGARGCKLLVRDLKIFRDIHYTPSGRNGVRSPADLGPDEYFMLGDNSGNSQDSREWPKPGVPEGDFIGKPFVIHQPLRLGRSTWGGRERVFQTLDWSRLRWLH
ncbi:MAG TPA: S26 family signal peptidase, partial [Gemmataceae bacterium]|nr:S26 family signal peptidase [Gemmataceae bacterium]